MFTLWGLYEYCGIQRCGKTTLMIADLGNKILPAGYKPENVLANFRVFIPGVKCMETEKLIEEVFKLKAAKVRDIVILFDEVGQFMIAREYKNKRQTEFVNFAWQMPKRGWIMMYASNVGNSADVILRDATWVTIMPQYFFGDTREGDYIKSSVIYNYDCKVVRGIVTPEVYRYQELFDSEEAIE